MNKSQKIDLSSPVLDISAQNISQLNIPQEATMIKIVNISCNPITNGDFIKMFPELQILHADEINAELDLENIKLQQLILRFNEYTHFPGIPNSVLFCDISGNPLLPGSEQKLRVTNKLKRFCFGMTGQASQSQFSGSQLNSLNLLLRIVGCQTINKIVLPEKNRAILGNIRFQLFEDKDKFGVQIKKVNAEPVKNAHLGLTIYQILTGFEINQISQTDNIKLSTLLTDFRINPSQYTEFLQYEFPASNAYDSNQEYNQKIKLLERARAKQLKHGDNYLAFCVEFAETVGVFLYSLTEKKFIDFEEERKKVQSFVSSQVEVKAQVVKSPKKKEQVNKVKHGQNTEVAQTEQDHKLKIRFEDEPEKPQPKPVIKNKTQKKKINLSDLESDDEDAPEQAHEEVELEVYNKKAKALPQRKITGETTVAMDDDIDMMSHEQLRKYATKKRQEVQSQLPSEFMPGQMPGMNVLQQNTLSFLPNQQSPQDMTQLQQMQMMQQMQMQQFLQIQQQQSTLNPNILSQQPPIPNFQTQQIEKMETKQVEIDYLHLTPKRCYVDSTLDVSNKRDIMSVIYYITDKSHNQINSEIAELLKFSKHVQSDVAFLQAIESYNQSSEVSVTKQKQEMFTYLMVGHAAMKVGLKCIGESIYGITVKDKYYRKHIVAELKYPWGSKLLFHPSPCYMHIDGDFTMYFDQGRLQTNVAIENYTLQLYHNSQLISQLENQTVFDLAGYILKRYGYSSLEEFQHLKTDVMDGAIAPRYDGLYQALLIIRQFDGTIEKEISCTDLLIFGQVGEEQ